MERWSGTQRAFAIKKIYKKKNGFEANRREFRHLNISGAMIPSHLLMRLIFSSLQNAGSSIHRDILDRRAFWEGNFKHMDENENFIGTLQMSDEAYFQLCGSHL